VVFLRHIHYHLLKKEYTSTPPNSSTALRRTNLIVEGKMCQVVTFICQISDHWLVAECPCSTELYRSGQPTHLHPPESACSSHVQSYKQYEWKWIAMTNGAWPVGCSAEQCVRRGETTCWRDPSSSAVTFQSLINRFVYLDCHLNFQGTCEATSRNEHIYWPCEEIL